MRTTTVARRFTGLKPRQAPACGDFGLDPAAPAGRLAANASMPASWQCCHLREKVDGESAIREPDQSTQELLGGMLPVGEGVEFVYQPLGMHPAQSVAIDRELAGVIRQDHRVGRDCQEFRVQAMTMGRKEPTHGTPQSTDYP